MNFIVDESNRLFTQFIFWNGYKTTIPYDDVIHIRYNFAVNVLALFVQTVICKGCQAICSLLL